MRVVFDTNVVVSALIFGNRLAWLRTAWAARRVMPVVSEPTADELRRVLGYPKFRLPGAQQAVLLSEYFPFCEVVEVPHDLPRLAEPCRDRDDLMFLSWAAWARAPLLSGDHDLAALRGVAEVEVLSAAELRARLSE